MGHKGERGHYTPPMQGAQMSVVKFRPFKIPQETAVPSFSPIKPENLQKYMEDDLKASGLDPSDLHAYAHSKSVPQGARAAYIIPYFDPSGQPIVDEADYVCMWRKKCDIPGSRSKYIQPPAQELARHDLPRFMPYILPETIILEGDTLYVCEGEKKTASFIKYIREPAIGIGGCRMWHNPEGEGVHPWILEVIRSRAATNVVIVPDGDLWQYDICKSYGDFARSLESYGINVTIVDCPDKIDDLIVKWGPEAQGNFHALKELKSTELFQSPANLMKEYNLPFRESKDKKIVEQHSGTISILLEKHPAFPLIWRNTDNSKVYLGDGAVQPDATEMQIANHMQINFGLNQVKHTLVRACMMEQATKHEKSPFLERVRTTAWDQTPRLATWMIEHWGMADNDFTREASQKWLIGSVARLSNPGCKFDWMLVVTGGQGIGKTSMPAILFDGHDVIMYGEHNDKDLYMRLHSGLCIVIDELDGFTKKDTTFWKSVLSTNSDSFRAPYAAAVSEYPRRSVLYGTSNYAEFLQQDPSGYRRYAILESQKTLDFDWLKNNRWQLWAEAHTLYTDGKYAYWDLDGVNAVAESHVIENPLQQRIMDLLDMRQTAEPFQMIELLGWLEMDHQIRNTAVTRDIAAILRSLDYIPTRKRVNNSVGPRKCWQKRTL